MMKPRNDDDADIDPETYVGTTYPTKKIRKPRWQSEDVYWINTEGESFYREYDDSDTTEEETEASPDLIDWKNSVIQKPPRNSYDTQYIEKPSISDPNQGSYTTHTLKIIQVLRGWMCDSGTVD